MYKLWEVAGGAIAGGRNIAFRQGVISQHFSANRGKNISKYSQYFKIFQNLYPLNPAVEAIHQAGVIIGDFNDLNALVKQTDAYIGFTDQANAAFQRFAQAGMNLVKSTQPMETWPGIVL